MAVLKRGAGTAGWNGRVGNAVFVDTPNGTIVRSTPAVSGPPSNKQTYCRNRMSKVSRVFGTLSAAQRATWQAFGQAQGLSAQQAFVGLSTKLLQMNETATLPTTAPSVPFFGDGIGVSVSVQTGVGIVFTASAANKSGVVTELLTQRLKSAVRRSYTSQYRSQAFVTFSSGALSKTVSLPPGTYATAIRFVESSTGRVTNTFELGLLQLPG